MNNKILKFFLLFCCLSVLYRAYACDCDSILDEKQADFVFTGKVLSIVRIDSLYIEYQITFQIDTIIKGKKNESRIKIYTPCLLEACCGIPFKVGDYYYVTAFINRDKVLYTNYCCATNKIEGP